MFWSPICAIQTDSRNKAHRAAVFFNQNTVYCQFYMIFFFFFLTIGIYSKKELSLGNDSFKQIQREKKKKKEENSH